MKKIFTLALVASLAFGASAATRNISADFAKKEFPAKAEIQKPAFLEKVSMQSLSRAEDEPYWQEGDNACNFLNWNFYYTTFDGKESPLTVRSTNVNFNWEKGEVIFYNYMGYENVVKGKIVDPKYDDELCEIEIPLGQVVYEGTAQSGQYAGKHFEYVLAKYDQSISKEELIYEGNLTVMVGYDLMMFDDATDQFGIYVNIFVGDGADKEDLGVAAGAGGFYAFPPNSEFTFDLYMPSVTQTEEFVPQQGNVFMDVYEVPEDKQTGSDPVVLQIGGIFNPLVYYAEGDEFALAYFEITKSGYAVADKQLSYAIYDNASQRFLKYYFSTFDANMGIIATTVEADFDFDNGELNFEGWSAATGLTAQDYYMGGCQFGKIKLGKLSGIKDVEVDNSADNSNAPVEYFNLQGMRIANPAAGQIVIRRQGTEVSKLFVK